jgi:5'-nucleotidase
MKNILLTNDDGINAPALEILKEKLATFGKVTIVAPETPRSAAGSSLTLHKPIRINKIREDKYSVSGTPSDCVRTGTMVIINEKVDVVVSGVNEGANMGDDISYSGTVAAAREAALLGIPAVASSLVLGKNKNYCQAADLTVKIVKKVLETGLPVRKYLNLNVPDLDDGMVKGVKIAHLGVRVYDNEVRERTDPAGKKYYWIIGEVLDGIIEKGTDFEAISQQYASLTPLSLDYTDYPLLEELKNWALD